jgi:hypothetical protein
MIRGVRINFSLRIFITSRKIPDMHLLPRLLEHTASVTLIEIPKDDSTGDIRRYIRSRMDTLSSVSKTKKRRLKRISYSDPIQAFSGSGWSSTSWKRYTRMKAAGISFEISQTA